MATAAQIKQEIVDYLNVAHAKWDTFSIDSFPSAFYQFVEDIGWRRAEIELASGTAKVIDYEDAGEGDYSAAIVLIFEVNGQFFRVEGRYESWAGSEWEANDLHEVEPVQVMVTQYQRKDANGI